MPGGITRGGIIAFMRLGVVLVLLFSAAAPAQDSGKDAGNRNEPSDIGSRKVATGPNFYSIEKELALGEQLAREVEKQAKLYSDPIVSEYVNRLAQNLTRHSDVTFPVTVKIVESDQPNAFTLPGGHIFVDSGLIRLSESEAELAAAISHELGHVAARHATRQATTEEIVKAARIPVMIFGGCVGPLASQAAPLGFMKYSRVFENEADLLGLQYLYATGYDPAAAVDLFERIEALEHSRRGAVGQLFSSHPVTADRIARTEKNISRMLAPRSEYMVNTSEYEDIRQRLVTRQEKQKEQSRPILLHAPAGTVEKDEFRP